MALRLRFWPWLFLSSLMLYPISKRPWTEDQHFLMSLPTQKTNFVVFSPKGNYTYWATVGERRILLSTFADRGMSRSQRGDSRRSLIPIF
jgi:hypothetical protein